MKHPAHRWPPMAMAAVVVIAVAAAIALLYLARAVLVPVTLAMVLSFATAPFVRTLRRLRIGRTASVLVAVLSIATLVAWLAALIGSRAAQIAEAFPAYRDTFASNVQALRSVTLSPMEKTWDAAERLIELHGSESPMPTVATSQSSAGAASLGTIAVELRPQKSTPMERMLEVMSLAWVPLASGAIVIVVMIFALLEHASIRDRFIRLVGGSDLRATTTAINDAGERLTRYLARLFAVNIGVGLAIGLGLAAIGLPDATLVATSTALLRFVPFLGVPAAAAFALLLALSAAQGWSLALSTLALFAAIELITAHAIEPRVYGNATGLSPLAIVLAAIFWGGLWGPIGVLLSTPLTLCMAVAGRHFESLGFLGVVLGDGPALTMAQKFYQRALSGDPAEIVEDALSFLKHRSFAEYCDAVVVPALQLGRTDREGGLITTRQYAALRSAIVHFLAELEAPPRAPQPVAKGATVLDEILSSGLRWRQNLNWYGLLTARRNRSDDPLVRNKPVVLCLGMGLPADELGAELLVRVLRAHDIDARHIKDAGDLDTLHLYGIANSNVSTVCMVTMTAPGTPEHGVELAKETRLLLPHARMLGLLLPGRVDHPQRSSVSALVDCVTTSFADATREFESGDR